MGYTLLIGQAVPDAVDPNDNDGWYETRWTVAPMRLDNAPADGSPTDFCNARWPSYSAWDIFAREVGLYHLFYGNDGLLLNHPGCVKLTKEHLEAVMAAECKDTKQQGRLEWLRFWIKWALDNCDKPAMANS